MKKLLACLTTGLLTTSAVSSVVACSEKLQPSLNDESFKLQVQNDEVKYDILRWSSEVLTANAYKEKFISLFKEHNSGINGSNPWTILELIKGQKKDSERQPATLISEFLARYQRSSNTGNITDENTTAQYYDQQLTYKIYDQNNNDQWISTFNNGEWNDAPLDIKVQKQNDVFVIHLKIAVETEHATEFIGARQNIANQKDLEQYYPDLKNSTDMPRTDKYDYRYDIQFYFSIS